jgi:hypothetical protein
LEFITMEHRTATARTAGMGLGLGTNTSAPAALRKADRLAAEVGAKPSQGSATGAQAGPATGQPKG